MNMRRNNEEQPAGRQKRKFRLSGLIYHNSFVLACSFLAALIGWFVTAAGSSDLNRTVYNVPIQFTMSAEAEADGLRVWGSSYQTVDIEVSGSTMITSKLTAEDFEVTAALNPTSTKLTGNTTQKAAAQVHVAKKSTYSDYEVVSISPEEITLEYDRYKEVSLTVENEISFTAGTGFYPGTPVLSAEKVTISGPESSVNKISRAAVVYNVDGALRENKELSCPIRLYGQDGQEIVDTAGMYLSMDVDTEQVTVPVYPKKTVPVVVTMAHRPAQFSDSRITVEPASIDLAGSAEALGAVSEIRMDNVIDFAELDPGKPSQSFQFEIPIPQNTRNITNNSSNTAISQVTVTINLNGYKQQTVTVPESNIQVINGPGGDLAALPITKTLEVTLAGPEAQVQRLTGDSVMVQVDMSNVTAVTGNVDVPATVTIPGSSGEACWVLGSYTMAVTIGSADEVMAQLEPQQKSFAQVAAAPPSD